MDNLKPIEPYYTLSSDLVGAQWEYQYLERELDKLSPNTDEYNKAIAKCKVAANNFSSACLQVKEQYDKEQPNPSQNIKLLCHIMQSMHYNAFGSYL